MHGSNLLWLETEARARMTDRHARTERAARRVRPAAIRFPGTGGARRVIGRGLVALGARPATPRPLAEGPAA